MIKKTVEFTNLDGNIVHKDLYFHLNSYEISKLAETGEFNKFEGGIENTTLPEIVISIGDIIFMAYGERTEDGNGFNKSKELSEKFRNSLAYDVFMDELLTTESSATEFVENLIGSKFVKEVVEQAAPKPILQAVPTKAPSADEELKRLKKEHPELF